MSDVRFAILGAGHGGRAMAADLANRGFTVKLFNRTYANVEAMARQRGIELEDEDGTHHTTRLEVITSDMGQALEDVDVAMVVVPASGHYDIAQMCAPHLRDGQVIVLNPGRTGGALAFRQTLRQSNCTADVTVAEAGTFIFAARSTGPAQTRIFRRKHAVPVAALPATHTSRVLELVTEAYPQFVSAPNVLHTSLDNMGAIFHPALTLLNAGRIESTRGEFQFYVDGVTPSVARVLRVLDRERVTVAAALGIRAQTATEWLQRAYSVTGENLYEAIQANPGYRGIQAPRLLRHRYIFEDVPFSLVPIAALGGQFGVDTPAMDSMIYLASIVHGTDYWLRGRTLDKMGISGLRVSEIHPLVETGETDRPF